MENNMYGQEENFRRCRGFIHVIEKGDTLYKLGKKYGVRVGSLLMANPYVNVYNLQIGDELCIPRLEPVDIPASLLKESKEYEKNNTVD